MARFGLLRQSGEKSSHTAVVKCLVLYTGLYIHLLVLYRPQSNSFVL